MGLGGRFEKNDTQPAKPDSFDGSYRARRSRARWRTDSGMGGATVATAG
jgi:hypothetical protein